MKSQWTVHGEGSDSVWCSCYPHTMRSGTHYWHVHPPEDGGRDERLYLIGFLDSFSVSSELNHLEDFLLVLKHCLRYCRYLYYYLVHPPQRATPQETSRTRQSQPIARPKHSSRPRRLRRGALPLGSAHPRAVTCAC